MKPTHGACSLGCNPAPHAGSPGSHEKQQEVTTRDKRRSRAAGHPGVTADLDTEAGPSRRASGFQKDGIRKVKPMPPFAVAERDILRPRRRPAHGAGTHTRGTECLTYPKASLRSKRQKSLLSKKHLLACFSA